MRAPGARRYDTQRHRGTADKRLFSIPQCVGVSSGVAVAVLVCALTSPLAAQLAPRPTRPQVTPPQGKARQVIFKYCTSCHGIDDYAYNALDRAAWDAHLTAKHRGVDITIPAQERAILLDWLAERFGPTTKPFPRTYVAREVTTFFSDAEAETYVRFVYSPLDALKLAQRRPEKQVVFFALGCGTTAPCRGGDVGPGEGAEPHELQRVLQPRHDRAADQSHPGVARASARRVPRPGPRLDGDRQPALPLHSGALRQADRGRRVRAAGHPRVGPDGAAQLRLGRCEVENQYSRVVPEGGNAVALDAVGGCSRCGRTSSGAGSGSSRGA